MRTYLRIAAWTWAALALTALPGLTYLVAAVYGAGVAELARRYGPRAVFWTSLVANPAAWLALYLGLAALMAPADPMNLGTAIAAFALLALALGAAALALMAWSRRPLVGAAVSLLWAGFWPKEALFPTPEAWPALAVGALLGYLAWPWRDAAAFRTG
ncbi:hypothetical protein [Oceanithermus sp.]|uniref:hypothetical protein n=1 Tax=Oceanithermus sp. TaxID=2268145 RepID=UPI00257AB9AB|nr:hypothetical protein [Oceanithermus sp.]